MPQLKPTRGIQLSKSHLLARGIVGYLPFNEGTGKKVSDVSGRFVTGTLVGDSQWGAGKFGSVLDLRGASGYVDLGDPNLAEGIDKATILVRFLVRSRSSRETLISNTSSAGNRPWEMRWLNTDITKLEIIFNSTKILTPSLSLNTWYDVAAVYDGVNIYVYTDAKIGESAAMTGDLETSTACWIGSNPETGSRYFDGLVDSVIVYSRALTAFEIAFLKLKPFVMFGPSLNVARISSVVANGFVEIAGSVSALSFLTDSAALRRTRGIAGGVAAQSSLAGSVKVSKKISGVIAATSSLSGALSLVGEVSRSRGSGFKPIEGAERLRGLRRSAFY